MALLLIVTLIVLVVAAPVVATVRRDGYGRPRHEPGWTAGNLPSTPYRY